MPKTLQTSAQRRADERARLQEHRDLIEHKLHLARCRLDPAGMARRAKAAQAKRKRELLDPNHAHVRFFPTWADQGIAQYIRTFQALNAKLSNSPQLDFVNLDGRRFT
jgi:hypothetical protein